MTNYGALTILALPRLQNARMTPGEAELRLLLDLATFPPNGGGWHGDRLAGTRLLAEQAGLNRKTVMRARDRLVKAGLIECEPGTGTARSVWRFLFPQTCPSGPTLNGTATDASGDTQDGTTSGGVDINVGPLEPGRGGASGPNQAASGDTQAGTTLLSVGQAQGGSVSGELSRAGAGARPDDDAQPDWRTGPGDQRALTGRVIPPGRSAQRGTPMPPNITGAGRYHPPQAVTDAGAAAVRAAMAEGLAKRADRGEPAPRRSVKSMTEDERRQLAIEQAATGRRARLAGEPPGGLTPPPPKEEPDDELPF